MIVIYDDTGKVWYNGTSNNIPSGLPFLEYTPEPNKYVEKVDVSGEVPSIVFKDYPKSEMQLLRDATEKQQADIDYLILLSDNTMV